MTYPEGTLMDSPCAEHAAVLTRLDVVERDVRDVGDDAVRWRGEHERKQDETTRRLFDKLEEIVASLKDRPPVWVTFMLPVLTAIIGALVALLAIATR